MSEPEIPGDFELIEAPPDPPSAAPDAISQRERSGSQPPKLTPTDRLESAFKSHIESLKESLGASISALGDDKRRLLEREAILLEENGRLQGDLDRLRPELAAMIQARRVAGWLGTITTILLFVGSCLISHAGTLPDGEPKTRYRALGWSLSGAGVLFTVLILTFGWPPKQRRAEAAT